MAAPSHVSNAIYDLLSKQCPAMWLGFPIGTGVVYWVDSANGNDGNNGKRPDEAFATITFALTQCVDNNNDYIMVIEDWQEAATITVNVDRVHIIGLANYLRPNTNNPFVGLNSVTNDFPIFTVGSLGAYCEIAGFMIGGGANHAGIENPAGTPSSLHIHDNVFGHSFSGNTPQDGIFIDINATNIRIENNVFLGTPHGKGVITRDGIRWATGGDPLNGNIENNQFKALPGVAINFVSSAADTGGISLLRNTFNILDTADGEAITLGATLAGMLVDQNHAMYGNAQVGYGQNPYRDLNAPNNDWGVNYRGNTVIEPVIV
ncbi:hypothetical protein KKF61_08590 [Patescibacteria group bacterium]|nr:hypothetical protein [Patescibacteria group bacterium]